MLRAMIQRQVGAKRIGQSRNRCRLADGRRDPSFEIEAFLDEKCVTDIKQHGCWRSQT